MNLQPGWTATTLGKVLTREQMNRVRQILAEPVDSERNRKLRAYCISIQPDLLKSNLDAVFFSYVLENMKNQGRI